MSLFNYVNKKRVSRANRSARLRSLALETLETRELLAVTAADYTAICNLYSEFNLPENMSTLNVKELSADSTSFNFQNLQNLIDQAATTSGDDLIVVRANSSWYQLNYTTSNKDLTIDIPSGKGSLTIVAYQSGSSASLILNGASKSRCLTVESGDVNLGNIKMTGGLTTTGGEVPDLGADSDEYEFGIGGGILNKGTLTAKNVSVESCRAGTTGLIPEWFYFGVNSLGGGIYNQGTMNMYSCTIKNNIAEGSIILENMAERTLNGVGGGFYNDGGTLLLTTCTISGNKAQSDEIVGTITTSEPEAEEPTTETISVQQMGQAGALFNAGGTVRLIGSTVADNSAWDVAGIYNDATEEATPTGGTVILEKTTLSGHSSSINAGGIYNAARCNLTVNDSFIRGNTTAECGGGILTLSTMKLVNSVVSGNTAMGNGGGISVMGQDIADVNDFEVSIVNSTITGNKVTGNTTSDPQVKGCGAGLYFCGYDTANQSIYAQATVSNSIIVNNLLSDATSGEDSNIYNDGSGSLVGKNSLSTFSEWSAGSSDNKVYNSSIRLFISDYDFSSQREGNYQLWQSDSSDNSQAINQGNNTLAAAEGLTASSKDVHGNVRIKESIIDMGAYECQEGSFVPAKKLDVPKNVSAETRTATSVTVTWSPVEHAVGYKLEYQIAGNSTWTKYNGTITADTMSVSSIVTGLTGNQNYSFRVKATGDGINYTESDDWSTVVTAKTYVGTLVVATEKDTNDNDDSVLSLREAVALAGTSGWGTNVVFASSLNGATISLSSDLTIDNNTSGTRMIMISAESLSRGVTLQGKSLVVNTNVVATITGISIAKVAMQTTVSGTLEDIPAALQVYGTLNLDKSQIADNVNRGIYVKDGTLIINNSVISNNGPTDQRYGAGVYGENATITITNSVIRQNGTMTLTEKGGGICALDSNVTISGSSIEQNNSPYGGGIYFDGSDKTLSILSSKITGNVSLLANTSGTEEKSGGGGIYQANGKLELTNSLIAGNMVNVNLLTEKGGSAVYYAGTEKEFSLVNCTVTGNWVVSYSTRSQNSSVDAAAIVVKNADSSVGFSNSIIAGNQITFTSDNPLDADLNSQSSILGKNNITGESYTDLWANGSASNTVSSANDLFTEVAQWSSAKAYLGGNYNLKQTATAINTGDNTLAVVNGQTLAVDVDGNARIVDSRVDIGAYEAPTSSTPRAVIIAPDTAMEGCAVYLDASNSVVNGGSAIEDYLWDLDGDGEFGSTPEEQGESFWFDLGRTNAKNYSYDGTQYTCTIGLKVRNTNGNESLPVYHTIALSAFHISLDVTISEIADSVVKLSAIVSFASGNNACSWRVNWGDNTISEYNATSNRAALAHYYSSSSQTYPISICVIDTDGLGRSSWFTIGMYSPAAFNSAQPQASGAAVDAVIIEPEELIADDLPVDEIARSINSNDTSARNDFYDIDLFALSNDALKKNKVFMGTFTE